MPMNGDLLAEAIAAEFGKPPTDFLKILCAQIVLHIQTYASVALPLIVTGATPPGGGVVTGTTLPSPPGVIK